MRVKKLHSPSRCTTEPRWGADVSFDNPAVRCGAVRCGAVRCGADSCFGEYNCGAVWFKAVLISIFENPMRFCQGQVLTLRCGAVFLFDKKQPVRKQ